MPLSSITFKQMQDELVNNPNMSEQKKWGIEDKITKLSADRDVLNWRRSRTTPPAVEDFEAKKGYIEQQKQFNQDAIVNGLGNGTLKVGSDEWYAFQKKGDKLQEQIDAYNRGMMGVLDGEKAVTKSEQEMNQSGINNANSTIGREPIQPGINNANSTVGREQIQPGINNANSMTGRDSKVLEGLTTDELNYEKQADVDSFIQENNEARQTDKEQLKEEIISDHIALYKEAMIAVKDGDFSKLNNLKTFIYKGEPVGSVHYEQLEKDLIDYALEAENYEQLCKDIDMHYDKIEEEEIKKINDEYAPYFVRRSTLDRVGELDENPEFTLVDWYSEDYDMNVRMQGYENERIRLLTEYGQKEAELYKSSESLSHKEWLELNSELINKMDAIKDRLNEIDKLMEDTRIALNGSMEDMSLTQLTIWAENEFQNSFKELEQEIINDSLEYFNTAIDEWIAGDDTGVVRIVTEMYGGSKYLNDIEDFNQLRAEYVQYHWESLKIDDSLAQGYEQDFNYIIEEMSPYLLKAANYQETENGYTFEMTPELAEYAIQYAQAKEHEKDANGKWHTGGATASFAVFGATLGFALGPAGAGVGAVVGALIGIAFSVASSMAVSASAEKIAIREDEWDDIAIALLAKDLEDGTFVIEYDREAEDVVGITKKE